ncbi:MAG TPA: type II secretion system protein GspK [Longimicrobium sp.]|nr:type II secretion system protein GspK [Longimicrobium sp.]
MRRGDRRGFALIAVLWALVLAAALAAELHAGARGDLRGAAAARAAARARWAARGGLAHAEEALRARLSAASAAGAPPGTDTLLVRPLRLDYDGVEVRVTVVDARARVQLNLAAAGELRALGAACGLSTDEAYRFAYAVTAWRAEHGSRWLAAPEDTLAVATRPPAGAFRTVEELRAVPGVTAAAYAAVGRYLSVAGDGRVNLNTAPPAVLSTLPGFGPEAVDAVVDRRRAASFLSAYEVVPALPPQARGGVQDQLAELLARAAFTPRHAEVRVEAKGQGAAARARIRAVAVLAGGRLAPLAQIEER